MNNIINNAFKQKKIGATRYTYIKAGRNKSYFTSDPLNGDNKYTASDICKMIEFTYMLGLVDSFFDIPMSSCVPLLDDFLLYSYENEFLDKLIGRQKEVC